MSKHQLRVVPAVVAAVTLAALLLAVPGGAASAATGVKACKVSNLDQGISRDSLQRAVWAADPGDTLLVQGTCVGTTLIGKDLTIGWTQLGGTTRCDRHDRCTVSGASGRPTLKSGTWRPAIVVDPRVRHLHVLAGLRIQRGIVIDQLASWKRHTAVAPAAWRSASTARSALTAAGDPARSCAITNVESGASFRHIQTALAAASGGDHLRFRGRCGGLAAIDKPVHIEGYRVTASSISCSLTGCRKPVTADSGEPVLAMVVVSAGLDDVTLKRVTVPNGFSID